ncbi:cyclase family protein [Mycolicibacterium vinylchloridicum]|uniref:cyclase family protein n=1 Tax=Mycolicibacterium vinylchloridicum TaxID=2736928 RepID=UPI001F25B3D8|nr:cyclase family protein [Mycolicibacterium vinylchloridicum]
MNSTVATSLPTDMQALADKVRNWGRWGEDDELGTLNLIDEQKVAQSARLVRTGRVFSMGADFDTSGPQGAFPTRTNPLHFVTVDAGCSAPESAMQTAAAEFVAGFLQGGPARYNDDYIVMPLQASTQWDALSHVYYDDAMYNGFPATAVTAFGAARLGIEKPGSQGVVSRGVLLDLARHRGVDFLDPDQPIMPSELDACAARQDVAIESGDIVLIRTGWWDRFIGSGDRDMSSSGLSWRCAEWLHENGIAAVAADNVQVEPLFPEPDSIPLGLHCLALRDMGMSLGELWDLRAIAADCAQDGVYDFQLIAPPIRFTGGIGSPLNPVAIK